VQPLRSNNPIFIAFHEWMVLGRDVWQARSWRDRWSYLFGPPGWQPEFEGSIPDTTFEAVGPGRRRTRLTGRPVSAPEGAAAIPSVCSN
jgi:hypothetical protein